MNIKQLIPKYDILSKSDNLVKIRCYFSQDYPYFLGHFPNNPILPGFVQLGLAYYFIEDIFLVDLSCFLLKQVKYKKLVRPNSILELYLVYDRSYKKIEFIFQIEDEVVSSGIFK